MSGGTAGDSDEAMRLAFEQYMMGGSGASTATTIVNEAEEEELMARQEEARKMKVQAEVKKAEKTYLYIFKRFMNRIKDDWLDIDDQAYQVVKSIAGIRRRLPSENKMLRQFKDVMVQKKSWACHGIRRALVVAKGEEEKNGDYECSSGAHVAGFGLLTEEDIELALSHDLMQHEKMMSGLRSLFAQLSDCHEALMRMLDEMNKHHLDCSESFYWGDLPPSFHRAASLEGLMSDLLAMLSLELYRKQCMVHEVLEKVKDDILRNSKSGAGGGREDDSEWEDLTPQGVVDRCCRLWPKGCLESSIEITTLENALDLVQG